MSDTDLLQPGEIIKPQTDETIARHLLKEWFSLEVIEIREMNSYDDRNYFVKLLNNSSGEDNLECYTLKITNSLDSKKAGLIDAFNDLSLYLKNNSLDVCHPMMDRNGKYVTYHDLPNNNAVRLVSFLPGKLLFEIPYTETVLFKTGKLIATLTQTMENYKNDVLEKRNFLWSFLNALKVKTFLFAINDARRQAMINEVLERFEKAVLNKLDSLKSGIIHGDLNDQNLIVRKGAGDEWDVYGIIDFGDCHKAPIIFDLAIACTYLMLECKSMDPLLSPAYVIAGYQSLRRVEENEFDIIYISIAARICQSLVMGAYSYSQNPGNEYLLCTAKNGWTILEKLLDADEKTLKSKWTKIIKDAL